MIITNEGNKNSVSSADFISLENACSCPSSNLSIAQNVGCVCGCSSNQTISSTEQSGRG